MGAYVSRPSKSGRACGAPRFVATPCHVAYNSNLQFTCSLRYPRLPYIKPVNLVRDQRDRGALYKYREIL